MVKNRLRACLVEFKVNVNADGDVDRILDYKKQWDEFLGRMNSEASVTAHNAFHTSSSWVDAEAAKAIIGSTQETIAISAVCGWFGVLLFTLDVVLACLVGLLVLGIIIGLAFFMVAVMGWNIGAIEVIALVVFVGYSITYSLHIAHHYSTTPADDPSAMQLEELAISRKRMLEPYRPPWQVLPVVISTLTTCPKLPKSAALKACVWRAVVMVVRCASMVVLPRALARRARLTKSRSRVWRAADWVVACALVRRLRMRAKLIRLG